ncbi:MAG: hypothetical protein N2111_10400 [Candidatus Sumerlaeaceae bacterium]|nr:hypothetical protein [Candidatus Sumerlaeaceae bacterium]
MKRLFFAAASILFAGAVYAASVTETFEGLSGNGSADITGTPSITGFTLSTAGGAAPYSSIGTASPFPGIGSTKYFVTDGSVNDWVQFNGGTIATNANTIQFAYPLRVVSFDPTDTDVDIMTLDHTAGTYSPYFNVRGNGNNFRTTNENGWPGAASPISTTAWAAGNPSNWATLDGGRWHLLAWLVTPNATNGSYKVWDINPLNGSAVLLQSYSGAANPTVQATVNRFALGLCIAGSAVGTANTVVHIDDITFWDDAFATEAAFLNAVRTKYAVPAGAAVEDWSLF